MPEWSIGPVSKTGVLFGYRGFESLSLRPDRRPFFATELRYIPQVWLTCEPQALQHPSRCVSIPHPGTIRVKLSKTLRPSLTKNIWIYDQSHIEE